MTVLELSEKTGLSKQAISKIEINKLKPANATIIGICKIFNIKEDFFTSDKLVLEITNSQIIIK